MDVVDLELVRRAADAAVGHRELAPSLVAVPDLPLHVRGDVVGLRGPGLTPWLVDEPLALRVSLEEEVERGLEDLVCARAGVRVRERCPGRLELPEEALRDGEVNAAQLGGERLGRERASTLRCQDRDRRGACSGGGRRGGVSRFFWKN
jgi:hypothetical protein